MGAFLYNKRAHEMQMKWPVIWDAATLMWRHRDVPAKDLQYI